MDDDDVVFAEGEIDAFYILHFGDLSFRYREVGFTFSGCLYVHKRYEHQLFSQKDSYYFLLFYSSCNETGPLILIRMDRIVES